MADNSEYLDRWLASKERVDKKYLSDLATFSEAMDSTDFEQYAKNMENVLHNLQYIRMMDANYNAVTEIIDAHDFVSPLADKVEIVDEESGKNLEGEQYAEMMNILVDAKKLDTIESLSESVPFSKASRAQKEAAVIEKMSNSLMEELALMYGADGLELPNPEDIKNMSGYEKTEDEKLVDSVREFFADNKKIKLNSKQFLAMAVTQKKKSDNFFDRLANRFDGYKSKTISGLSELKEKFGTKIKKVWGETAEITANVADSIANNSLRTIVGIGASLSVAATVGTVAPAAVAIAAYGAYSYAAGKYWPAIQERQKAYRAEKGLKRLWGRWLFDKDFWNKEKLRQAMEAAKARPGYKHRHIAGIVSAAVCTVACGGAGVATAIPALKELMINNAIVRGTVGLTTTVGATSSQIAEYKNSVNDYVNKPSEFTKHNLKSARIGLGLGLAASAAGAYFSLDRLGEGVKETVVNSINNPAETVLNGDTIHGSDSANTANSVVSETKTTTAEHHIPAEEKPAVRPAERPTSPRTTTKVENVVAKPAAEPKSEAPAAINETPAAEKAKAAKPVVIEEPTKAETTVVENVAPEAKAEEPVAEPKTTAEEPATVAEEKTETAASAEEPIVEQPAAAEETIVSEEPKVAEEPEVSEPAAAEETTVKEAAPEVALAETLDEKEAELHTVLQNRYGEDNPQTAEALADKSFLAYRQLLEEGKTDEANKLMQNLHEDFEDKEVLAARREAYKIEARDSAKLAKLKSDTKGFYNSYVRAQKEFDAMETRLNEMRAADEAKLAEMIEQQRLAAEAAELVDGETPAADGTVQDAAQNTETPAAEEIKLEPSRERLELELKHSQKMEELVNRQVQLAEYDMKLHTLQLKEDLAADKDLAREIKKDIREWDCYEKKIGKLDAKIEKLATEEYNPEDLTGKGEHDVPVSKESSRIANENLEKFNKAEKLKQIKAGLEKEQAKLGTREDLEEQLTKVNEEISEIKGELKNIRRGLQEEVEEFMKDAYEGSEQQIKADAVKVEYAPVASEPEAQTIETVPEAQSVEAASVEHSNSEVAPVEAEKAPAEEPTTAENAAKAESTESAEDAIQKEINSQVEEQTVIAKIHNRVNTVKAGLATEDAEITTKTAPNGVVTTTYDYGNGEANPMVVEYPNGKAAIIQDSTVTLYTLDGKVHEYVCSSEMSAAERLEARNSSGRTTFTEYVNGEKGKKVNPAYIFSVLNQTTRATR